MFSPSSFSSKTTSAFIILLVMMFHILAEAKLAAGPILEQEPKPLYEAPNSHLACFPAKLSQTNKMAIVQLIANEQQKNYGLNKCKIRFDWGVELCIPSTKKILNSSGLSTYNEEVLKKPQQLTNDFICYHTQCNSPEDIKTPEIQKVFDQFGRHNLMFPDQNTKVRVCVPAWKLDRDKKPIIIKPVPV